MYERNRLRICGDLVVWDSKRAHKPAPGEVVNHVRISPVSYRMGERCGFAVGVTVGGVVGFLLGLLVVISTLGRLL